jgi:hypothetical protein
MTNKYAVNFSLSKAEQIIIELEDSLEEVHCCYSAKIAFMQNKKKFFIGNDSVRHNLELLKGLLTKALKNKLKLHKSITTDIGYLDNEYLRLLYNDDPSIKSIFSYEKLGESKRWVGDKYHLWGYGSRGVWIYNDIDGSIIFEVTPAYAGGFAYPEKCIPYNKWIKKYKPYLIRIIPQEVAQQWLDQTNAILKQIEKNIKRLIAEDKFY